ncbi:methionyl-tRNA formyltransferase [Agaribacter flavus]|uniref:Methionyl-tRNA formyltransferase n=1 Tax=Agaribacter flavus TaxID=1902781 RepID=A0ABV7FQR3_9ALTE
MRIVFAGTPDFAAAHLQALLNTEHEIVAVYSQPDRPAGRGKKLTPSAVKSLAQANNIAVEQPLKFSDEGAADKLASYHADVMVVVAYGLLLPEHILNIPKRGCINVHGSILPKWRGAAPIQRAIWAGDKETGVAIMQMDKGLDTGKVIQIATLAIEDNDTSASLYNKLAALGPRTLVDTLAKLDTLEATEQNNDQATYAKKLSKEEARCDWSLDAQQLARNVRAFNPWPVAWFDYNGQAIKIWEAEPVSAKSFEKSACGEITEYSKDGLSIKCASGLLLIKQIQLPNKKRQAIADLVNGKPDLFAPGQCLL